MKKDPNVYLEHILESIGQIETYTNGLSEEEFFYDIQRQDAVFRRMEIMGEATKRISKDIKDKHKNVNWKAIMGMRDKLIHDYDEIDPHIIWATVQEDVPILKIQLVPLKGKL